MINLIGAIACIAISLIWYMPGVRLQGDQKVLQKGDYLKVAFLYGLLISCLLIIITEITWDIIFWKPGSEGLAKNVLSDFFRAALLEEAFKFLGIFLAVRALNPQRKIDFMMIAGMIGLMYGIVEKVAMANAAGMVVGVLLPMHLLWQLNQGGHYFEYKKARLLNDQSKAGKELFMMLAVPYIYHGCWDSAIDIGAELLNKHSTAPQVIGGVLIVGIIVLSIVYMVRTIKKMRNTARNSDRLPDPGQA